MDKKLLNKAKKIYAILDKGYPDVSTTLGYQDPLQLMVATILSAQCTDKRVNMVTKDLFKKYKKVKDYASAEQLVFQEEIRSTGFYRNKAKNIISAAKKIISDFNGQVPEKMEELITLSGVARKTANIVLFYAFGKNEGIAVDTHVKRVSFRLGLTSKKDPLRIERDLIALFPRKTWGYVSNLIIEHGRSVCNARKPLCLNCELKKMCSFYAENND